MMMMMMMMIEYSTHRREYFQHRKGKECMPWGEIRHFLHMVRETVRVWFQKREKMRGREET